MDRIGMRRSEIYEHFQGSAAGVELADPRNEEAYVAYYTGMYLLQDSTEALTQHRSVGFSADPLQAYIEFWGVMQAVIIQQDAIKEIHRVVFDRELDAKALDLVKWTELRKLRNVCAGHPARRQLPKSSPLTRSFMARGFGNYEEIKYEQWEADTGRSFPRVALDSLLDGYATEAETVLVTILDGMRQRWPLKRSAASD